jgi:hypothetical protein
MLDNRVYHDGAVNGQNKNGKDNGKAVVAAAARYR